MLGLHLAAQQELSNFKRISPDLGLSHQEITSIYQDEYGFIWMTSPGGVDRYDGYKFQSLDFDLPIGVNPDGYTCIFEPGNGEMWLGTKNEGIIVLDAQQNYLKQYVHSANDSSSLAHNWAEPIIQDSNGNIWVATYGGGIHKYDSESDSFIRYQNDPEDPTTLSGNYIYTIKEDAKGHFWIGTEKNGLNEFDPITGKVVHLYLPDPDNPNSLGTNAIYDVTIDQQDQVWVLQYRHGLGLLNRATHEFKHYTPKENDKNSLSSRRIYKIYEQPGQGLWIGTQDQGLSYFDFETDQFSNFSHDPSSSRSISSNNIISLFIDKEENLWIGTSNGPNIYHKYANQFVNFKHNRENTNSLPTNSLSSIHEDSKGQLWIGTHGEGISIYDKGKDEFTHINSTSKGGNTISDNQITDIQETANGSIVISTRYGGLNIYNPTTNSFTNIDRSDDFKKGFLNSWVFNTIEDNQNRIWAATPSGLSLYDPANEKFTHFTNLKPGDVQIDSRFIRNVFKDSKENIWAFDSTTSRWFKINSTTLEYEQLDLNLSPIVEKSIDDIVWLSTNKGIASYNFISEELINYGSEEGLPTTSINGISQDKDNNYWLSTSNGLWLWQKDEQHARQFTTEDGLITNTLPREPFIAKSDGWMYLLSENGLSAIDPKKLISNPHIPDIQISSFKYFDSKDENNIPVYIDNIEDKDEITFPYHFNILSLELASLSYNKSSKNQYQYQLNGLSNNWINLGTERNLTLTNLDPKTYTLNIRGSNGDGVWNNEGTSIKIKITPPWWASWWAYLFYFLATVGLILAYVKSRTNYHKNRLEEERKVVERLKQVDKLKDQFLANTSHELRTPLNGIIGLSDSLIDGVAGNLNTQVTKNLTMISSSGRRLANLVNDILDFSKLKNQELNLRLQPLDMHAAIDVVLAMLDSSIKAKGLKINHTIPENFTLVEADEDRVQQILFNLIGNAIKFTKEGSITISTNLIDGRVYTSIEDTGIGIPADKLESVFTSFEQGDGDVAREFGGTGLGLSITRLLVNQHKGDIDLKSKVGKGTEVIFSLPVSNADRSEIKSQSNLTPIIPKIYGTTELDDDPETEIPSNKKSMGKILVVDDEAINRQVLENHLSIHGFTAVSVADGASALEAIESTKDFDLVLLDIMMPRMSGYEVAQKIRERLLPSELPIIMLTAKNRIDDLITGFKAGANDYLTKPFVQSELIARTKTHINLRNIHSATKKFVPDEFIRTIGRKDITDVELGDFSEKTVTVLFTDIRDFTSISEKMSPEDNFEFVRSYVSKMGPIIEQNHGFINQYLGDGIMAIFANDPADSLNAAIQMQITIRAYNEERVQHDRLPIRVGMGMMTGSLVMGIIGDENRKDTTSISDTVNVASRLEGLTKYYGANIILSNKTIEAIQDSSSFNIRNLGHAMVKGKTSSLDIYECYDGDNEELFKLKKNTSEIFNDAIESFMEKDFNSSLAIFERIKSGGIPDRVIDFFITDCKKEIDKQAQSDKST